MKTMDLNASTLHIKALETLAWSLFRWWRGQLRHHYCRHLDMGPGGPGGPGWGPGPGGPGVFFGGFANGLCSMISSWMLYASNIGSRKKDSLIWTHPWNKKFKIRYCIRLCMANTLILFLGNALEV
ncbi:hypothetical protein F2P56_018543 [Juglans regia]|uniref:Uncharacterized protein n=2 Tax=Juglans regia TaxID=51240 RepID=A0A833U9V9_JUGRE|nr:uncharacterized protein LOC108997980 isoform X4 [Juglans regia]KAF5462546.1 hypothetical protein F2P56_018543 [Juglans regia]